MEKITRRVRDISALFSPAEYRMLALQEDILMADARQNFTAVLNFWKKKRESFVQHSVDREL